jgi:hypothetical protein
MSLWSRRRRRPDCQLCRAEISTAYDLKAGKLKNFGIDIKLAW